MITAFQKLKAERRVESGGCQKEVNIWLSEGQTRVRNVDEKKGRAEADCPLPQSRVAYEHSEVSSRLLATDSYLFLIYNIRGWDLFKDSLISSGVQVAHCRLDLCPLWSLVLSEWNTKSHAYSQGSTFKKTNSLNSTYCLFIVLTLYFETFLYSKTLNWF